MSSKQKDLISQLSSSLKPVQPIRLSRTFGLVFSVTLLAPLLFALLLGFRKDLSWRLGQTGALLEGIGLLSIFGPLLYSILKKSIPGRSVSALWNLVIALGCGIEIIGLWIGLDGRSLSDHLQAGIERQGLSCSITVLVFALIPSFLFAGVLKKLAPERPALMMGLSFLVAAISGAFAILFHCPANEPIHDLIWHLGPLLPAFAIGFIAGSRFLKW